MAPGTPWATGNADRAAVEVKHAFFDVAIPYFGVPVPMTMRFGIQAFAIRDGVFYLLRWRWNHPRCEGGSGGYQADVGQAGARARFTIQTIRMCTLLTYRAT